MEVNLRRVDYAQIGSSSKGCLRIIAGNRDEKKTKNLDKIVCGGHNGVVLCMARKNGETQVIFKTIPGPQIDCVRLGGALGTVQDKIFVATKNCVKGYTKRGKQFLSFKTVMTESINSMYIYGVDMFLCGQLSFYHYHDCVEANSYLCSECINDIICLPITEGSWVGRGITPIIACDDKTLKVLNANSVSYELQVSDIPSVLHLFLNDGGYNKQKVLYGTKNGHIGLVDLPPNNGKIVWEMRTQSSGAITNIDCYRITGNSPPDVIIGKEDGLIEIYSVDENDQLIFRKSFNCEESVISIQCGRISSENFDEIVVCTYTGWIFALTTEPLNTTSTALTPQVEIMVQRLRNELEELEIKVSDERQKYNELILQKNNPFAIVARFAIQDQFVLDKDFACYLLSIELIVPIDFILLQSDVPIELLDMEKSSSVVSIVNTNDDPENAFLATYRCQANTTRIEIRIRSVEGEYGTIRAYICPEFEPKLCQMRMYSVKPLSLHERIHEFDTTRPLNVLKLTGNFSITEAHHWLALLVSEVPDRNPPQDIITFNFASIFNGGTQFQAVYSRGSATYHSDNISTIAIIRDVISKEVTSRQIKVQIQCEINEESVAHTLHLMHPKIQYYNDLLKQYELAKALRELSDNGEDLSYLSADMIDLLKRHDDLYKDVALRSSQYDRLIGMVTDLYIDRERMCGRNGKSKIEELLRIISNYDPQTLLNFFSNQQCTR